MAFLKQNYFMLIICSFVVIIFVCLGMSFYLKSKVLHDSKFSMCFLNYFLSIRLFKYFFNPKTQIL